MAELFQNVLTASFHGSIVIAVVLILRLVLRRAPKKFLCMLWLLAGLRLLMPFEIESNLSLQPETDPVSYVQQQTMAPVYMPELDSPLLEPMAPTPQTPAPSEGPVQPPEAEAPEAAPQVELRRDFDWIQTIPYIWLAVACCFGVYTAVSYLKLKARVREAVKIPGGWECDRIDTAFILGFIKPRIYVPMGMPPSVRRHILAHERTHLEKGDHWYKMIGFIALAIHWFNPLVWLAYILLCKDIEMACDERVVQFMELSERKDYSAALLRCSTNKAHFAACPVAFGEVSVKHRIQSVLRYRRPGFWISLLGVAAIVFVAVCLLTSPSGGEEDAPDTDTQPIAQTDTATTAEGFASKLTQNEIPYVCDQALEELKSRDSYYAHYDLVVTVDGSQEENSEFSVDILRHGENKLTRSEEDDALLGNLIYEGQFAANMGDLWCWNGYISESEVHNVDSWLDNYSSFGKNVSFPEGTGVLDGDTVSYGVDWTESKSQRGYTGTITFTFWEDGTIAGLEREYSYQDGDGQTVRYHYVLTLRDEKPEAIEQHIRQAAEQVVTEEELSAYRLEKETVTEVPSNKTSYDKEYGLGSESSQWQFFGEDWHVRIGAENVTNVGLELVYSESGNNHSSFGADQGFWLEQLVNDAWVLVDGIEQTELAAESIRVSWTGTDRYDVDWSDSYGTLDAGFYRIGRYHTVTLSDGQTQTRVCYAKFRLYDPNMDALLDKCLAAVENLKNAESSHILATSYDVVLAMHHDRDFYSVDQFWKSGRDYLAEYKTYTLDNPRQLRSFSGAMWRDGKTYNMSWSGETVTGPVTEMTQNTYMDQFHFVTVWESDYIWYDSQVEGVVEDGNQITILESYDFNEDYEQKETLLTFDGEGKIASMRRAYLPKRNCAESEKVIEAELVVFDSVPGEIEALIAGQKLSVPPAFSWEEDQTAYPAGSGEVRTKNFVNTQAQTILCAQDAIDIALADCTLPASAGLEPGTNMMQAYYDETAKMWKVEFTASWDDSIYQAVYLDSQGITRLVVTLDPEAE